MQSNSFHFVFFSELYMHLSTSSLADSALVAKLVCSNGLTATQRGLGPMATLEFLVSLFLREDLLSMWGPIVCGPGPFIY